MKTTGKQRTPQGFTIVELLIVIIVIGILAALILVAYSNVTDQAKASAVKNDLEQLVKQINTYKESTGKGSTYPADASSLTYSSGTTLTYSVNNSATPATFCVAGTNGNAAYVATNVANAPAAGYCSTAGVGTVGWWKLNGNVTDASTSGNTGGVSGPVAVAGANGTNPGAYSFSGGSSIVTPVNNLPTGSAARTVSAWVYATAYPASGAWSMVNTFGLASPTNGASALSINPSGRVSFNANSNDFISTLVLPLNTWHFVAYSISGTTVSIYMDGQSQASTLASPLATQAGTVNNIAQWTGGFSWNGYIDDLRIYNSALPSKEVAALYAAGAQ